MIFLYGSGTYPNYCRALEALGISVQVGTELFDAQALLLPGGGDIFGMLDEQERNVIQYFVDRRRPILGICRGMQALNVYFGGTLHDNVPGHQSPTGDIFHTVTSALRALPNTVNSNHHQAVDRLGAGLIACQWARDGVVEAFYHAALPVFGVQYHPERMVGGNAVFEWFYKEGYGERGTGTEFGAGTSLR